MLVQTLAHALVMVSVAVFWTAKEILEFLKADKVFGIAGAAAVEEI